MEHLTVYQTPFPKIRIGKDFDGGYIICDLPDNSYDILLSGGIAEDLSFEEEFLLKYYTEKCICFDGTIDRLPDTYLCLHDKIDFVRKNLGNINNDTTDNMSTYLSKYNNIFLKLDIEGGENELFQSLNDSDLQKFKQIVIEFHSANQVTIPKRLMQTHWLVHLHGNNCCGTTYVNGINVPNIFECTYIRKDLYSGILDLNKDAIPNTNIDQPNVIDKPDIILRGKPFVS